MGARTWRCEHVLRFGNLFGASGVFIWKIGVFRDRENEREREREMSGKENLYRNENGKLCSGMIFRNGSGFALLCNKHSPLLWERRLRFHDASKFLLLSSTFLLGFFFFFSYPYFLFFDVWFFSSEKNKNATKFSRRKLIDVQ